MSFSCDPVPQALGNHLILKHIFQYLDFEDLEICHKVCVDWSKLAEKLLRDCRILRNIFRHLSTQDLKQCRLVCKTWKYFASEKLKTKTKVDLRSPERVHDFIGSFDQIPPIFVQFRLGIEISLDNRDLISGLANFIGPQIKYLKLDRCKWKYDSLRYLLFEAMPSISDFDLTSGLLPGTRNKTERYKLRPTDRLVTTSVRPLFAPKTWTPAPHPILPNMKRLNLDVNMIDQDGKPRHGVNEFLTDFLKSVPNLEYLNAKYDCRAYVSNFVLRRESIKFPNMSDFNVFYSRVRPNHEALSRLESKQFPLTTIHIQIESKEYPTNELCSLLMSLKNSLTHFGLIVSGSGVECELGKEFPRSVSCHLKKIKSFRGRGICNFNFLADFEKLETLTIEKTDMAHFKFDENLFYPKTSLFKRLQFLHFIDVVGQLDKSPFKNLYVRIKSTQTVQQTFVLRFANFE